VKPDKFLINGRVGNVIHLSILLKFLIKNVLERYVFILPTFGKQSCNKFIDTEIYF